MVSALAIARFLNKKLYGEDLEIDKPASLNSLSANTVSFAKKLSDETLGKINAQPKALVIAHTSFAGKISAPHVLSDNPRLDFAYIMQEFFAGKIKPGIAATARIGQGVLLGKDVCIGEYTVIDDKVAIGDNTVIGSHVRIKENVSIGSDCIIRSHVVIGEPGFGFERNEAGVPVRLPHIGGVIIGDNVEIGDFTAVVAGTLDPTVIEDNTKIDNLVHIAHNCAIDESCMVIACAEVSGSVKVGKGAWIGPNASVLNNIKIGEDAFIGIGSTVIRSVEAGVVVAGNPARALKNTAH